MIKNVIFDFGKVLLDWNPHFLYDSYFASREECDYFLDNIMTIEWNNDGDIGTPMMEVAEKWARRYPEYAGAFYHYVNEFPNTVRSEIPGMYELIVRLKNRGIHVWGLSNWSWETFQKMLHKYRIFSLLEGMVVSGREHVLKPSPEIYHILLDRYSLDPSECVFTDDAQRNIDGAEAVGIKGILFKDAAQLEADLEPLLASGPHMQG